MPIKIPETLPAYKILEDEGVLVIKENDAIRQDIRPLRIALLNLMPSKIKTETQIARVLGNSPLQVEMTLLCPSSYIPKNTPREHMLDFYRPFAQITGQKFDGLIITGAPVEILNFEEVNYWLELCEIFDWTRNNVHSLFNLCWGAQAALNYFYKIKKHLLKEKLFGIYNHHVLDHTSMLTRGLNDIIPVPTSRHTEIRREDLIPLDHLEILMDSPEAGICLVHDRKLRHIHMFNHLEYDTETLNDEFERDKKTNENTKEPRYYFDTIYSNNLPANNWRSSAHLLFGNWLNYLYQTTPYNSELIGCDAENHFNPNQPRKKPGHRID